MRIASSENGLSPIRDLDDQTRPKRIARTIGDSLDIVTKVKACFFFGNCSLSVFGGGSRTAGCIYDMYDGKSDLLCDLCGDIGQVIRTLNI